jgi:hypothetical protein
MFKSIRPDHFTVPFAAIDMSIQYLPSVRLSIPRRVSYHIVVLSHCGIH